MAEIPTKKDANAHQVKILQKNKVGRPPKYHEGLCSELIELMSRGLTDTRICAEWQISREAFYEWLREKKEFREAHQIGEPLCLKWWEEWGEAGMRGELKGFNYQCWISFMNNKWRHLGWCPPSSQQSSANTQINIGNINVFKQKSEAELLEFIKDELKDQNIIDVIPDARSEEELREFI